MCIQHLMRLSCVHAIVQMAAADALWATGTWSAGPGPCTTVSKARAMP